MSTRTVLITGAAGGIGGAAARRLHDLGWEVYAGVRRASDTSALPAGVHPLVIDLIDEETLDAAAKEIAARTGGRLDALVNNAGVIVEGPVETVPLEEWRRQFDVNVIGQVAMTQAVLPMLRTTGGRVVNIGAVSSRMCAPTFGPIAASKAALASVTEALRMEMRPLGVRVSLVEPGAVQTEIFAKAGAAARIAGWRGDPETQRLYRGVAEKMGEFVDNGSRAPVDGIVKTIVKALTARRPAAVYLSGRDARIMAALAKVPGRTRDRLVLRTAGVGAETYGP
ncbi:SDR family NAD(P)-dependent oxidoreductase [Actinomadura sp. WMMB 499]|uniref:SDR family NAD(P)-dependent oxidoreductase n=1 Tax=Actinomadura sp. WMMB 499 TaxID=1219491 RepID=UPI00124659B1|nr:SDR family NAD(P)-dependent oxidoreductase [Actinomadura sp. WMMB 499]QFG26417.1 SDR family NAD(P)-dependent oxidoreductase [Actinomadura sp. WMMB 499]